MIESVAIMGRKGQSVVHEPGDQKQSNAGMDELFPASADVFQCCRVSGQRRGDYESEGSKTADQHHGSPDVYPAGNNSDQKRRIHEIRLSVRTDGDGLQGGQSLCFARA
ncbi:MAG UNVERIFIED_CONTAM: hypothetical protein LVR18_38255 [Planctomycetaceae bacterium]|jgi:hypothetical protein